MSVSLLGQSGWAPIGNTAFGLILVNGIGLLYALTWRGSSEQVYWHRQPQPLCGPYHLFVCDHKRFSSSYSADDNPDYIHYFKDKFMSETDVTISENLITAEGNAYIEFAVAVGKELNIFEDREDELETVLFFKNQLRG